MPGSQPDPEEEDAIKRVDFDDLHDSICYDDSRDPRYAGGMSNALKTAYICQILNYPENGFDLDLPFPLEDWIESDNQSLMNCGLYLNDLRTQFYSALMYFCGPEAFKKHAEAEYWRFHFNSECVARIQGDLLIDDRTLN